ncbi:hypothetical protein [Streptomyces microflavus]|uniref:hypothetical protein n=1 Tax=Streptomyces microflavus TaxID=1919 RepID=UPI003F4CE3A7
MTEPIARRSLLASTATTGLTLAGVGEISVSYAYEKTPVPPGIQGNALDIGLPGLTAHLVTDQDTLVTTPLPASGKGVVEWRTTPGRSAYVRAEVRHPATVPGLPGALAALTDPVFLTGPAR